MEDLLGDGMALPFVILRHQIFAECIRPSTCVCHRSLLAFLTHEQIDLD